MAVSVTLGPQSLVQLGVSAVDIGLLFSQARQFGNWLRTKVNEDDLFDLLEERPQDVLRRVGIIDPTRMEARFSLTRFIYNGTQIDAEQQTGRRASLGSFSWFMAVLVSVLDLVATEKQLMELVIDIFVIQLDNPEAEDSLRLNLDVNLRSWRSTGKVRGVAHEAHAHFAKVWKEKTGTAAIPTLNGAEMDEMKNFLVVLFSVSPMRFQCMSAAVFAAARAMQRVGVDITTDNTQHTRESQLVVGYAEGRLSDVYGAQVPGQEIHSRHAQVISYQCGQPGTMIETLPSSRPNRNKMAEMWAQGQLAAVHFRLEGKAELPYDPNVEFFYTLNGHDEETQRFESLTSIIAGKAFPFRSQHIRAAIEELVRPQDGEWLLSHIGLEYLQRETNLTIKSCGEGRLDLWSNYQALVFGFYFKLLEPLVVLDFLATDSTRASAPLDDIYFQGLWGWGNTRFLAMCTQFGQLLWRDTRVERSHVIYLLSAMYAGRDKMFVPKATRTGLLGLLGPMTTILALPLLRTTDVPEDLTKYAVLNLPVIHLTSENEDGEVYTGHGLGHVVLAPHQREVAAEIIQPHGPSRKWSVHATMRKTMKDSSGRAGVVMVARCDGRPVGWFGPGAADTMFLSTAYTTLRHDDESDEVVPEEERLVRGTSIEDEHWVRGTVWRPGPEGWPCSAFGVVQSKNCPALRYAAAGFYGASGEELAIATNSIQAAFQRIEGQDQGVLIA